MRRKEIPKRSGGVRVLFCPSGKERRLLRKELGRISSHTSLTLPYAHGFMSARSPLTAAKAHAGFAVTIGLDLKDFFPSVKPAMVKGLVPKDLSPLCWAGDGCGQGLPTAPAIANLAAKPLDDAVIKFTKSLENDQGLRCAYTRYADDLSLSLSPDPGQEKVVMIKARLSEIVRRCGFMPNKRKWRVQRAAGGRREIVGLLVGATDDPIRPTRVWRRRYRALAFALGRRRLLEQSPAVRKDVARLACRIRGWQQWLNPRMPLSAIEKKARADRLGDTRKVIEASLICTKIRWPAMLPMRKVIPEVIAELPGGLVARITNDPAYFIGMSDFVTRSQRTASCARTGLAWGTSFGQYGGTGAWWWALRGCSIAQIIDPKHTVDCAGVQRAPQLARVLLFKLAGSGELVYQRRIYTDTAESLLLLRTFLLEQGAREVKGGDGFVDGVVKCNFSPQRPFLDAGEYAPVRQEGVLYDRVSF